MGDNLFSGLYNDFGDLFSSTYNQNTLNFLKDHNIYNYEPIETPKMPYGPAKEAATSLLKKSNNSIKKVVGNFIKQNAGTIGGIANTALDAFGPKTEDSALTSGLLNGGTLLAMQSGNPYLIAAAVAANAFNKFNSALADHFSKDMAAESNLGADYMNSYEDINKAASNSDKRIGGFDRLFGKRGRINKQMEEARQTLSIISGINEAATDLRNAANYMALMNGILLANEMAGAYDKFRNVHVGRRGMRIKQIISLNRVDERIKEFKQGGIIEANEFDFEIQLPDTIEAEEFNFLIEIPKFEDGGTIEAPTHEYDELLKEIIGDKTLTDLQLLLLSTLQVFKSDLPRTEGNKIYVNTDEDFIHELTHLISNEEDWNIYSKYYENLDDDKLSLFGSDLPFIKRTGDPGDFYQPIELFCRIMAAKYKSKGNEYTPEFFKNLRLDEMKYGYNMRDLLHIYNDETLSEMFNLLKEVTKYLKGGSFNVIPEGALHARKHSIEMDNITKKGIPVISEEQDGTIELQAEIEKEEIILRLEVTQKLEEMCKQYYSEDSKQSEKDLLALEAGLLLVDEILNNTIDNTGLLNGDTNNN